MEKLQEEYMDKRKAYHGYNLSDDIHAIDAELVETVINKLERGKAADIHGLCRTSLFL